ncbi:MAG: 23S rRNA (uracil(1939)-C(5))-methyltransferase RlmD [Anaerolineae bacterium]|nr:23S rRNA (uracil(1939)-C(5))-methyltransferase RlmD [Anaerolineae bacterium]
MGKSQVITLAITAMADGGQAVGRHEGKVVFVAGALPGERVRARIEQEHKRWARAELIDVLEASPQRVEPPCPYFGECGGCHSQHIAYPAQLGYKQQIVVEQLQRIGHIEAPVVTPTMGMDEPWFYRNHIQFSATEAGQLGFQTHKSHQVIPIEQCLLLHPLLDELHAAFDLEWPELTRLSLRAGIHTGQQMCILETADDQAPELEVDIPLSCLLRLNNGTDVVLIGRDAYQETLRNRPFRISSNSFFQVNTLQTEQLLNVVEQCLEPQPQDTLLDVYCGVGTLSLSFAGQVGQIIGIEGHPAAVQDAKFNTREGEQATFIEGNAARVLPNIQVKIDKAIIDPPRKGCAPEVLAEIARLTPERIVYVSCDPTTLARDAIQLVEHGYALVQAQPLDMFPQTFHIETVTWWQRAL